LGSKAAELDSEGASDARDIFEFHEPYIGTRGTGSICKDGRKGVPKAEKMIVTVVAALTCCSLSGTIHSVSGTPVSNASVMITRAARRLKTTTAADGRFTLTADPGTYEVDTIAKGYALSEAGPVEVNRDLHLDIALEAADAQNLRPIGSVYVDGRLALSRNAIPGAVIARAEYEANGYSRILDALPAVPSITLPRPDGGNSAAPAVVALRGPDPSETLVALDGQILNDGNTGDLDLSRLPVAAFTSVNLSEGLGPKDLEGSDTIGGAVNLISLQPTVQPHAAYSVNAGSFGKSESWLNASGTRGRLGYAMVLNDQQETGYVNEDDTVCPDSIYSGPPVSTHLGSSVSSRSVLANLVWNFSQGSDVGARIFSLGNVRDVSAPVNALNSAGQLFGPGPAALAQSIRTYDIHGRASLGSGFFRAKSVWSCCRRIVSLWSLL